MILTAKPTTVRAFVRGMFIFIAVIFIKGLLFMEDTALLGTLLLQKLIVYKVDGSEFSIVMVVVAVMEGEDNAIGLVVFVRLSMTVFVGPRSSNSAEASHNIPCNSSDILPNLAELYLTRTTPLIVVSCAEIKRNSPRLDSFFSSTSRIRVPCSDLYSPRRVVLFSSHAKLIVVSLRGGASCSPFAVLSSRNFLHSRFRFARVVFCSSLLAII
ncbi:hypothetical protein ACSQ67_019396 [Phaseolus vulgaris]